MTKNFLQDIVPPKRSIRNIPLPSSKKKSVPVSTEVQEEQPVVPNTVDEETVGEGIRPPEPPKPPRPPRRIPEGSYGGGNNNWVKPAIWIGGVVAVLVIIFVSMNVFSGAKVTVVPKQMTTELNERITTQNVSNSESISSLTYKVVSVSESASKEVRASGEEEVNEKASGIITIYNNFTESSQPLVRRTRFESPDGKIYRIDESITVPGKTSSGPGQIDAEVFAEEAGDDYNIDSAEFTIPGFAGQPQFDGFSAETKTAIDGGFSGTRKIVSEDDLNNAENELRNELTSSIMSSVESQVNGNSITLIDDKLVSYTDLTQGEAKGDSVVVEMTATASAIVFNKNDFSNAVASEALTIFNNDDQVVLDDQTVEISLPVESTPGINPESLIVEVSGSTEFTWQTDHELLKQQLAGKSRKDLKSILQDFNGIAKAEAVIRPFWKSKFPEKIDKIEIIETLE